MATTTNSTPGRKTITLPPTAKNVRAALKAGEGASAARPPRPTRDAARAVKASEKVWIERLHAAGGFHRDALAIELAVGLAVFVQRADAEKVTLEAKKALNTVYAAAGYACDKITGEDYKTVNRRINVTASLFVKLGARAELLALMGEGETATAQMDKLLELVKSLKLNTVNEVLAYCGRPVSTPRPRNTPPSGGEPAGGGMTDAQRLVADMADKGLQERREGEAATNRRAEDRLPPGRIIQVDHMRVAIPAEATYEVVMEVAAKLAEFAKAFLPHSVAA